MLYAFGGRNQSRGPLDTVEMLDTWNGCWVRCSPMPAPRAGSAAAALPDGRMLVIGGYGEPGIAKGLLSSCDIYDPRTQRWGAKDSVTPLARARWGHGCAALGGKIWVVGGCSLQPGAPAQEAFMETLKCCEIYDADENIWSPGAPLQIARSGSRVVALGERYLVAAGGCDDVFGRAETQPTVELYDPSVAAWSLLKSRLAHPRTTAAVAAIDAHRLLVVGGAPSLSSAEIYHLTLPDDCGYNQAGDGDAGAGSAKPHEIQDMPEGRMGCQAAVLRLPAPGKSYPVANRMCALVVGGERCDDMDREWPPSVRQFASVPVFDSETGAWRSDQIVPEMAAPRTAVALCVGLGTVSDL